MIARVDTQQPQMNIPAPSAFKVADGAKQRSPGKAAEVNRTNMNGVQAAQDTGNTSPSMDELAAAVKEIAKDLDLMQTKIAVRFDKESNTGVMEVIDRKTGEVIKQVPPEEILKIKKAFHSLVTGFLLDERA